MVRSTFIQARRCLIGGLAGLLTVGFAAVIGISPAAAVSSLTGFSISPTPAATVYTGSAAQPGSNEIFTLANNFASGDTIVFTVAPQGETENCQSGTTDSVGLASTPVVTAVGSPDNGAGDSSVTIGVATSHNAADMTGCTAVNDVITLTLPAMAAGSSPTDSFKVTVSGLSYTVGSSTVLGAVNLTGTTSLAGTVTPVSDATVATKASASATGNTPVTDVTVNTTQGVSNIVVTEAAAGATQTAICITPIDGITSFTFTGSPSTVASPTNPGNAGSVTSTTIVSGVIQLLVTPSTTVATTYTISGIQVANGPGSGPAVASVTTGTGLPACSVGPQVINPSLSVYNSAPVINPAIFGADADGTAVAELETAFPINGGCVGSPHAVVLATDQGFADALSASYLASYLGTGILLTPTAGLSSETQAALQAEGITNVYVVGGTLAVSQNTINQVEATPAYTCGGPGSGTATGSNITVTGPIAGATQYDTSELIATTPPLANIGTATLSGAYQDAYNDTAGTESSAPAAAGALKTAIVASGANFPDASAASVMAYNNHFPLILTDPSTLSSQTSAALSALGIQQVIVLGGVFAISDADVTSIQALGISVIRIAGQDATDTAQQLASFELNQAGPTFQGLGWGATGTWNNTILVSHGDFFADALAGSVLAHLHAQPLLLTVDPSTIGTYLAGFLALGGSAAGVDGLNTVAGMSGNIRTIQPLGGALALPAPTLAAISQDVAAG
jgi:putative cell wall-binding protein